MGSDFQGNRELKAGRLSDPFIAILLRILVKIGRSFIRGLHAGQQSTESLAIQWFTFISCFNQDVCYPDILDGFLGASVLAGTSWNLC